MIMTAEGGMFEVPGDRLRELTSEIRELRRQLAESRDELDRYQGRTVHHCMERDLLTAADSLKDSPELVAGTILRATDTGFEVEWRAGAWWARSG